MLVVRVRTAAQFDEMYDRFGTARRPIPTPDILDVEGCTRVLMCSRMAPSGNARIEGGIEEETVCSELRKPIGVLIVR